MANNKIMLNGTDYTAKDTDGLSFYSTQSSSKTSYKLTLSGDYAGIVTISGSSGSLYGMYVITGYGVSTARLHVTALQSGSYVTYEVSSDEQAVTFTLGAAMALYLTVLTMSGTLASVT